MLKAEVLEPLALLMRKQKYRVKLDEYVQEKLFIGPFRRDNGIEIDASAERIVLTLLEWVNNVSPHLGARPSRPSTAPPTPPLALPALLTGRLTVSCCQHRRLLLA